MWEMEPARGEGTDNRNWGVKRESREEYTECTRDVYDTVK